MMEELEVAWRPANNEDNVSTNSSNSGQSSEGTSERRMLRTPHLLREGHFLTKRKTWISAGAVAFLVVIGGIFSFVHSGTGNGAYEEQPLRNVRSSGANTFYVPDRDSGSPGPLALPRQDTNSGSRLSGQRRSVPTSQSPLSQTTAGGIRSPLNESSISAPSSEGQQSQRRKTKRRRKGPKPLPDNAQDKPAMSLLLQMKLVTPHTDYFNYTQCEDVNFDKKTFKGWKASLSVNATIGNVVNPFVGYGKTKVDARRTAAELALMAVYPDKLKYPDHDFTPFKEYCDPPDE